MNEEVKKHIHEKLKLIPKKPGSYQMKNKDGIIIYVGKAKNLYNRVRSYFLQTHTGKTAMLVNDIVDFEYIVTSSELESLILEITLIKKYNPKYNILLKDDKSYPYIELTNEKYPRVRVVRNINRKRNKNHLYGPYPNVTAARKTVNMINRLYPLRKCENMKKDLCLYYHIGECLGYCKKEIDPSIQENMIEEITSFLKGNSAKVVEKIKNEMQKASDNLNFEKALELKEMLTDIDITLTKQKIDLNKNYNFDVFGYYHDNNYLSIVTFYIREGLLFGKHSDIYTTVDDTDEELTRYIIEFYEKNNIKPKEIIVPNIIDTDMLSSYLDIKVSSPSRGDIKKLIDLACENSKILLDEKYEKIKSDEDDRISATNELKELLKLDKVDRIEAFDNSHLFGTFYVGGMVVFDNFIPNKNLYRKYKIDVNVKDDLSAMREVLYRRYYKVLMEEETAPDLLLVDGGELQINVAKEIISSLGLNIPICGLKKNDHHQTNMLVNSNLESIPLPKDSNLFLFLTRIQDEVHNYAISYHRNIRQKGTLATLLDMAPGVGEVRRRQLLRKFGSLKKLKEASIEEIEEVLPHDAAIKFMDYLQSIEK